MIEGRSSFESEGATIKTQAESGGCMGMGERVL